MGARQIYKALREQILGGVYETGSQLPSSRGLANDLGVSRTTVTVAYEQLAAEGFIDVRQGARPRVASSPIGPETSRTVAKRVGPVHLSAYGERLRVTPPWPDYLPTGLKVDFPLWRPGAVRLSRIGLETCDEPRDGAAPVASCL